MLFTPLLLDLKVCLGLRHKSARALWFHFCAVPEQVKPIPGDGSQDSGCLPLQSGHEAGGVGGVSGW